MSDTIVESFPKHAPLSASSADGWTTCRSYVESNRGLPDTEFKAASEGTVAHVIRNDCLTLGMDADDWIGTRTQMGKWSFDWGEDDAELLQPGIDHLRRIPGTRYGEQRVDTSQWTIPGQFGTLDAAIVNPTFLYVDDLKFGRGVPVTPYENKQLILYALAFWWSIGRHVSSAKTFHLSIDQPRHGGGGGVWTVGLDELLDIGKWIKSRAELTVGENLPRTASIAGCRWCRRKSAPGGCNTYNRYVAGIIGIELEDITVNSVPMLPDVTNLTAERRDVILTHRDMIKKWLDAMYDQALADAQATGPLVLTKAVAGNKLPDKWRDRKAAEVELPRIVGEDKAFKKQLKTPKQVLDGGIAPELQGRVKDLIEVGQKKPILVPLADARPALIPVEQKMDE